MARTKTFLMRVDEDELAAIDRAAEEQKKSRSSFVREAALQATAHKESQALNLTVEAPDLLKMPAPCKPYPTDEYPHG